ncbi:FAD-dependent oxidoreductase [Streptomyces sp. NBC_00056]|uniref:FAD-dependent oxidoreductase n=1 Tax=unclassified Streptomyces TaxID=2593676 RepID=UPI0022549804|nr:FAD-dependent oxidoreductase [Streptomyces sp. NBC_00063]MCX5440915.1 FAD-dependent oxidoreductase [Streptomyces sp. NBC_00063]
MDEVLGERKVKVKEIVKSNSVRYDVIVIGAGVAGVTTARELATRGFRTLVVEACPEVGGRVRTTTLSNGEAIEIGGTYVHWFSHTCGPRSPAAVSAATS